MKKIVLVLTGMVILCSVLNSSLSETANQPVYTAHQVNQIIRDHFDEMYPGISDADKRNILLNPHYIIENGEEVFHVEISYLGEETMTVFVTINKATGEIIDKTPWDFAALIHDYTTSINRSKLKEIAMPVYLEALEEAKQSYPQNAQDFLNIYGEDALDPNKMVFEYLFVSPYGVGASDEPAYWQVFVEHPLDVNPITNALYGQEWFYVQIDAKTGEVSDSLSRGFFSVDTRLK